MARAKVPSHENIHRAKFLFHARRWGELADSKTPADEHAYRMLGHLGYMDRYARKPREVIASRTHESIPVGALIQTAFLPAFAMPFKLFGLSGLICHAFSPVTPVHDPGNTDTKEAALIRAIVVQACSYVHRMDLAGSARRIQRRMKKDTLPLESVLPQFIRLIKKRDFLDSVITKAYCLCQGVIDSGDKDLLSELCNASQSVAEFDVLMDEELQEVSSAVSERMEPLLKELIQKPSLSSSWWFYKHFERKSQRVPDDWRPKRIPSTGARTLITIAASLLERSGRIVLNHGELSVFPLPPAPESEAGTHSQVILWESRKGFPGVVPDSPMSQDFTAGHTISAKLVVPFTKRKGCVFSQWAILGDRKLLQPGAFFYAIERDTGVLIGEGNLNLTCDTASLADGSMERLGIRGNRAQGIALVFLQKASYS